MNQANPEVVSTHQFSDILHFPPMQHRKGSIGVVEKMWLGQLIYMSQPGLIVETGTFHGNTTRFLVQFADLNGLDVTVATFDVEKWHDPIRAELGKRADLVTGWLPESLETYLRSAPPVGLAIVDANHSYYSVTTELEVLHRHLEPGAYVFCHDYRPDDPEYAGLVRAVDWFAAVRRYEKLRLAGKDVWGSAVLQRHHGTTSWPARNRAVLARWATRIRGRASNTFTKRG